MMSYRQGSLSFKKIKNKRVKIAENVIPFLLHHFNNLLSAGPTI